MRRRLSDGQRFLVLCVLAGLLCGLTAVAFHLTIHHLFEWLWHQAESRDPLGILRHPAGRADLRRPGGRGGGALLRARTRRAAGSRRPRRPTTTAAARFPARVGIWRFVLGALYVGFGNSLGREGPTVHMSAAIASRIGRWAFRDPARVQAMLPVGMAAGIAAAFNAPLSALTFVFEELLDNFSMKALGGMVVAVVIAAAVSRTILGEDPVLTAHLAEDYQTSAWMLVALPLGVAAGLIGHLVRPQHARPARLVPRPRRSCPSGWHRRPAGFPAGCWAWGRSLSDRACLATAAALGLQHRLRQPGGGLRIPAGGRRAGDPAGAEVPRGGGQLCLRRLRRLVLAHAFPRRHARRAGRRGAGGSAAPRRVDSGVPGGRQGDRRLRSARHGGDVRRGRPLPVHLADHHFRNDRQLLADPAADGRQHARLADRQAARNR